MGSNPAALMKREEMLQESVPADESCISLFIKRCGLLRDSTEQQPDAKRAASAARRPKGPLPKALEGIPPHNTHTISFSLVQDE